MKVKKIMTTPAITCRAHHSLNHAAKLMWDHDIGILPVVDDQGEIVGVLTDRDAFMGAYTRGQGLEQVTVGSAMAKQVFTCRESDSLEQIEQLMSDKQIRRVPVVDKNRQPIGMVSLNDVARHAAGAPRTDGAERALAQMMANICEPRESLSERALQVAS